MIFDVISWHKATLFQKNKALMLNFGTPAITTRGAKEDLMDTIAELIERVLNAPEDETVIAKVRKEVNEIMAGYPLFAW